MIPALPFARVKRSKMPEISSAAIPGPLSSTTVATNLGSSSMLAVIDPAGGVNIDDISISIRPWPGGGLVSTRGKIYDHWAVSTADLDATVARLKRENVKFLEEIHPWGNSRAAMIEGPDRIAIELVEVK